ncbi:perilipin-3-like [Gopherus evgoodei]|uniref:perilipin-3-like n=1 Tax=Gopherus evgoodei TaxID=1825980 RepID=UPI0011CF5C77|nr:perilipin-3-like [Gopherus evgoodei]
MSKEVVPRSVTTPFCMSGNRSEIQAACPEPQGQEHQTAVGRVAGLPLVRSACEMASASYAATKETHQAVKAVCEVAETGVRAITSAAITGAQPILDQLDSQIAAANEYACKGLDTLEEKLPVLQQTVQKVASDAQDLVHAAVAEARDAVCSMAGETKDTVTSMVGVAKGAVQESMEMTKSAVTSSMNRVLGKSEQLIDHYLPMTEEELAELATPMEGSGKQKNYFLRLGSLSTKLRQRAYQHALGKMRQARQHTLEAISQLQQTIDLMEHAKQAVSQKVHDGQEKLQQMWLEWHKGQLGGSEDDSSPQPEEMGSQALATSHNLILQVQTACHSLLPNIQGLPASLQEKVQQAYENMGELQISFSNVQSFQELSEGILTQTREKVTKAQESLDELLEYVVQNAPLTWIVEPFAPAGDSAEPVGEPAEEKITA